MGVIVTTLALPEALRERLGRVGDLRGPDRWGDHLASAEAIIPLLTVRVDAALLERAPDLRLVANAAVGYDNVDTEACFRRGVMVTNTPDVLTAATADLTIALMLATVRRLPQAERSLREGRFHGWGFWDYLGGDLEGRTLGIFGMGRIGRAVARRARGFGMRIRYTSRTPMAAELEADLDAEHVDREVLFETSDVLSLHAPGTPETRHVINRAALERMKRGSYLINTARGTLVDEAALAGAIRSGHIAGAGLDVYEREPIVHPELLALDQVVLLPHIGSATHRTRGRMAELAVENVEAVLTGRAPVTPVPGSPRGAG